MKSSVCSVFAVLVLYLVSGPTFSAEPITVLLAKGEGLVSSIQIVDALERANDVLDNTFDDLPEGTYRFVSAATQAGGALVVSAACPSGLNVKDTALCAIVQLSAKRDQYGADIVVMFVEDIQGDCGGVRPEMVNAATISPLNSPFAYAVVDNECIRRTGQGRDGFAHEVGHLLSLEHHDGDPSPDKPSNSPIPPLALVDVTFNHAAEANEGGWHLTAMGGIDDCGFLGCPQSARWQHFYSGDGKLFPVGAAAGDSSFSDAERVIKDFSWDIVAAYQPLPTVSLPQCRWEPITCENTMITFTSTGVGNPALAQRRIGEGGLWEDVGSVLDSLCVQSPIQNATRTFFRMISIAGQELCDIELVLYNECGDEPPEITPW